jgi:hypothetical protein
MAPATRTRIALPVLGAAALLACWNPVSAPIAILVGLPVAFLGVRELRRAGGHPSLRSPAAVALWLAVAAIVAGATVLARFAGAGREREGSPIVRGMEPAERKEALDRASEATRKGRDEARRELEAVEPKR